MILEGLVAAIIANPHGLSANSLRLLLALAGEPYGTQEGVNGLKGPIRLTYLSQAMGVSESDLDVALMELDASGIIALHNDDTFLLKGDTLTTYDSFPMLITTWPKAAAAARTRREVRPKSGESEPEVDDSITTNNSSVLELGSNTKASLASKEAREAQRDAVVKPLSLLTHKAPAEMELATANIVATWPSGLQATYKQWIALVRAKRINGSAKPAYVYRLTGEVDQVFHELGAEAVIVGLEKAMQARGGVAEKQSYYRKCAAGEVTAAAKPGGKPRQAKRATSEEAQKYVGRI